MKDLVQKLINEGGAIVLASECAENELVDARETGRFYEDEMGVGFVWRYPEWRKKAEVAMGLVCELNDRIHSGYDWNSDPDFMTRKVGEFFAL